jgi:pimeloyl-ACP methyl ester carboxylesterase
MKWNAIVREAFDHLRFGVESRDVPRIIPPPTREGYATSYDGTPIYWELHGPELGHTHARPMVFCYGLVCSMNQWRAQLERYSGTHPCILFDYRGHHKSPLPLELSSVNLSALGRDCLAVLKHLQIDKPVHLWGHSMGVNVALEAALADPERIQSLVLLCGTAESPFKNILHLPAIEKVVTPILESSQFMPEPFYAFWDLMRLSPKATGLIAYFAGFNTHASTKIDIETYATAVCQVRSETFIQLIRELHRGATKNILARIQTPAAVVSGGLDHVTPISEQKYLASALPNSVYFEIPTGSHNVQLDFGEYVGLKVEHWWEQHRLI